MPPAPSSATADSTTASRPSAAPNAQAVALATKGLMSGAGAGGEVAPGRTFMYQRDLPKLPIPELEDTTRRYLRALEVLQSKEEREATKKAVEDFLLNDGPRLQAKLKEYAKDRASYIEAFWDESYLSQSNSVVLNLNPFFILEDDPTPSRGSQLMRAASLTLSSLSFIHDLRTGELEPDVVRGTPLDMYQFTRLFGTARIPTPTGCRMAMEPESRHVVILRRGQFYWFDALDEHHRPALTERELLLNFQAIMSDADAVPRTEVAKSSVGVLSTENRKVWSALRDVLRKNSNNRKCLDVVDTALFVVCLDDSEPMSPSELCNNMLCGTYALRDGVQVGTCTNRWYDKLQIIVCSNGEAGINFEHTGVDGHTVLRFAADVYTELVLRFAKSINSSTQSLFKAKISPHAKGGRGKNTANGAAENGGEDWEIETTPKKLEWTLTGDLKTGIRFAESRLSDLICQNECEVLEFCNYGKNFITRHKFSPDAYVQMAFQAAYFSLYGRMESTYEPAMTKAFLHGRTEAIRTAQPEAAEFVRIYCSDAPVEDKIKALRNAVQAHVKLTKECSQGQAQDRHLYAMYCLHQKEQEQNGTEEHLPAIFRDAGYALLNHTVLSTSNCGNPALRLFGFGPVVPDGFGIGYIIKDDEISICASSKHLQTKRFLDTLQSYLQSMQRMLIASYAAANARPAATFVDHSGVEVDARTGRPVGSRPLYINLTDDGKGYEDVSPLATASLDGISGYGFFDAGEMDVLNRERNESRRKAVVGRTLHLKEY